MLEFVRYLVILFMCKSVLKVPCHSKVSMIEI